MTNIYLKITATFATPAILSGAIAFNTSDAKAATFECTDAIGCVTIAPDQPIDIAVLLTFSGSLASIGNETLQAFELAILQRDNQLLGRPIQLFPEDEMCTPEGGADAANAVVGNPQLVGILGTLCSAAGVSASEIMSDAGLTMISGNNNSPFLTTVDGVNPALNYNPGYFRTRVNGALDGEAGAVLAFQNLDATKVVIVDDGDAATVGLTTLFQQTFEELGGEVVLEATIDPDNPDFTALLNDIAQTEAEFIYFSLFQPSQTVPFVQQVKQTPGLEDILLLNTDGALNPNFLEQAGVDGLGTYFTAVEIPQGDAIDQFATDFETAFGTPPSSTFLGFGFDAANLLLDSIEQTAIQQDDGSLIIGRQALRDTVSATENYPGVTGLLTCGLFGDCAAPPTYNLVQFVDPNADAEGVRDNIIASFTPGQTTSVPEPYSILGLLGFGLWGARTAIRKK